MVNMKMTKWAKCGFAAAMMSAMMMTPVMAQDISESHLAAARSAISAIKATERFDDILPGIALSITSQMIANNPDLEPEINQAVNEAAVALAARRGDLEKEAALSYAKAISEEDLSAIAEFYNSSAGKALLANGVILSREVQQSAAVWQRGIERDMLESVNNKLREMDPREDDPKMTTEEPAATETAPQ